MSALDRLKKLDASDWTVTRHHVHEQGGGVDEVGICRPYGIRPEQAELGMAFLRLAPQLLALWEAVDNVDWEDNSIKMLIDALNAKAEEVVK